MKNKLTAAIRILTFSGFNLMVFPLLYVSTCLGLEPVTVTRTVKDTTYSYETLQVVFRDARLAPALWLMALMVLASHMGAAVFFLRQRVYAHIPLEKPALNLAVNILSLLLPGFVIGGTAALTFRLELYWVFGIFGGVFCAVFGYKNIQKPYGDILTRQRLMVSAGVSAAALLLFFALKTAYSPGCLIWSFFVQAVLCALSQNQGNIDYLMERRKHDLSHLPRKVRWYSLSLTGGILLLMLLVLLFRPQLARLFRMALQLLRQLVRWILLAILWLSSLFSSEEAPAAEEPPPEGSGEAFNFSGGTGSPWWDYIMYTLLAALVLFLLWRYRREILRAFQSLGQKIKGAFSRLLLRAPALQRLAGGEKSEYYADQVETLPPESWKEERAAAFRLRDWKRKVKKLSALPPSPEKLRQGYGLGLQWLQWKGLEIRPADTPREILGKASPLSPAQWEAVTGFYQLVRYREDGETEEGASEKLMESLQGMAESR